MTPETRATLADLALVAIAALVPILVHYLRRGYARLADAVGVELSAAQRAQLDWAISQGVAYAEEWARQQVAASGWRPSGQDKLDVALSQARAVAPEAVGQRARGELVRLAEARLATLRPSMRPPAA